MFVELLCYDMKSDYNRFVMYNVCQPCCNMKSDYNRFVCTNVCRITMLQYEIWL